MQIDSSKNGLFKAWMNREVKKYCEVMMIVISQLYIPPDVLTEFVSAPSLLLIMTLRQSWDVFLVWLWQSKLVPWVKRGVPRRWVCEPMTFGGSVSLQAPPIPSPHLCTFPHLGSLSASHQTGSPVCRWCWCSPGPGWAAGHIGTWHLSKREDRRTLTPGPCGAPNSARERIHTSPVAHAVLSAF